MEQTISPVVRERNGKLYADSRDVAIYFGKEHRNVLPIIRSLLKNNKNLAAQFQATKFINRGKQYDHYLMTKDGFVMLMMKFTGQKAEAMQWEYIQEFNRMQKALATILDNRISVAQHDLHKHAIECRLSEEKARIAATALNERKKEIKWLARVELELREKYQLELI